MSDQMNNMSYVSLCFAGKATGLSKGCDRPISQAARCLLASVCALLGTATYGATPQGKERADEARLSRLAEILAEDSKTGFRVSFDGQLHSESLHGGVSVIDSIFPVAAKLGDQLLAQRETRNLLKLSNEQLARIRKVHERLKIPLEIALESGQKGDLASDLAAFAKSDREFAQELLRILDTQQLDELERRVHLRRIRIAGLAGWVQSADTSGNSLGRTVPSWVQKIQPDIIQRFHECKSECVGSLPKTLLRSDDPLWVEAFSAQCATNDPWLFGVQLRCDIEERTVSELHDLLVVGNPIWFPEIGGHAKARYGLTDSPRIFLAQFIMSASFGGIEAMDEQLSELRMKAQHMPPEEEAELQRKLAGLQSSMLGKAPEEVEAEFLEIVNAMERKGLQRLEESLVPFQKDLIRQLLFKRLVNAYGPWLVIRRLKATDANRDNGQVVEVKQSLEASQRHFAEFESAIVEQYWKQLRVDLPEVVDLLEEYGIRESDLPASDAFWLFRHCGAQ